MYVLALVTQKGGSGKSTLAVGLAVAAMENGERVAFVEADPQGTISKWKERRGNPFPRVVRVADPAEIEGALVRLEAEGIWLAIIDTAATSNALATHAITKADLCLIPTRPSPADIEAAIPTLIAIRRFKRRFAFVLNQTPPRGCRQTPGEDAKQLRRALDEEMCQRLAPAKSGVGALVRSRKSRFGIASLGIT